MILRKMRFIAMLSVASFIAAVLSGCDSANSAVVKTEIVRPVKLITIGDANLQQTRIFPAVLAANQQADLAFRISGELVKLDLMEGQRVTKGQLLAKLDDRDAKNALLNAEANFDLAELDHKRSMQLLERKLISKAVFDTTKASLKSTRSALNAAKDKLEYTRLLAPFSGIVAKIDSDNYQMIQATQVILSLQSNHLMDVTIQVPESFVMGLKERSFNKRYLPQIRFFSQGNKEKIYAVNYKERSSKVSSGTQTYAMTFSFKPPQGLNIISGMSAEVLLDMSANDKKQFNDENIDPIEILPQSAIVKSDSDGLTHVWRFNEVNKQVERVNVTLGGVRTDGIEILSGLNKGDKVIAAGAFALKAGMLVKPLSWERGV